MDTDTSKGFGASKSTEDSVFGHALNLFEPSDIDNDIVRGRSVVFRPLSENNEGQYEFSIDSQGENQYLQLSSVRLGGRCRILKADGTSLSKEDDVSIVNMFPASLFQGTETKFNNTIITDLTSNLSHYQNYMQTLTSYNKIAQETHLQGQLFIPDEAGKYESHTFDSGKLEASNAASRYNSESYIFPYDDEVSLKVLDSINKKASGEDSTITIGADGRVITQEQVEGSEGQVQVQEKSLKFKDLTLTPKGTETLLKEADARSMKIVKEYIAIATNNEKCNRGYIDRRRIITLSNLFDFYIPLCSDIFHSDKFLHPSISIKILLRRSSQAFSLLSMENEGFKIELSNLKLYTRFVEVHDNIVKKHKTLLSNDKPLRYPIERSTMKSFNVPKNNASMYIANMFSGILPKTIIIGMVENEAFYGKQQKNPYNFQHLNIKSANLRVNGESVPSEPIAPDFNRDLFLREYIDFYRNIGIDLSDQTGNMITPLQYKGGSYFMAFDLSGEQCNQMHRHKTAVGNIDFEGFFQVPLEKTITLIVYGSTDAEICVGSKGPYVEYYEPKTKNSA